MNRLQNAIYQKPNEVVQIYNSYNENLWYDKNGNITKLERNGEVDDPVNKYTIDNLTYIYHSVNKNQLTIVDDSTNITHGFKDDDTNPNPAVIDNTVDYGYDVYGNMTSDTNKGITQILYNHLNLPIKITLSNGIIEYLYNASGVKVQKKVTIGTTIYTTDYQSGYQYLNAQLQFFPHAEGYVNVVNGDRFNYVYNYTDHLGNIRVSYGLDPESNVLKILEENHYYPFGLKHKNYGVDLRTYEQNNLGQIRLPLVSEVSYNYKLKGKEWQDELGLNEYAFGFRDYDPAIGRWNVIDPLAEKYITTSPYAFVQNNPLINREIDGRYFDKKNDKQAKKIEKAAEKQANKLEKQANKLIKNGKSAGDLMDRVAELRNSAQDVRDMRSNTSTEFKYGKLDSKQSKALGLQGPTTTQTGTNAKGDNVVTMFVEKNMGNQIHETRHGGDVARGNLSFNNTGGYGVSHEISAYKAQYSYDGAIKFIDPNKNPTQTDIINSMQTGTSPWQNTINGINQINANFVNSLVDPGFIPIYPPSSIPSNIWNSN